MIGNLEVFSSSKEIAHHEEEFPVRLKTFIVRR